MMVSWADVGRRNMNVLPIREWVLYGRIIGGLIPVNIWAVLERFLGYTAVITHTQTNDVDVKVYDGGNLVAVMKVINWKEGLYYNPDERYNAKYNDVMKNLTSYDCPRYLNVSFQNNIREIKVTLTKYDITPIVFRFQTQVHAGVRHFTADFEKKELPIWEMKENSSELLATVQEKLLEYFSKKF